jgi:hypothetical protein
MSIEETAKLINEMKVSFDNSINVINSTDILIIEIKKQLVNNSNNLK